MAALESWIEWLHGFMVASWPPYPRARCARVENTGRTQAHLCAIWATYPCLTQEHFRATSSTVSAGYAPFGQIGSLARPNHKEMAKETAQVRRDPSLELGAARAPSTVCWEWSADASPVPHRWTDARVESSLDRGSGRGSMRGRRIERATILTGLPPGVAARDLVRTGWHAFCSFFRLCRVRASFCTQGARAWCAVDRGPAGPGRGAHHRTTSGI